MKPYIKVIKGEHIFYFNAFTYWQSLKDDTTSFEDCIRLADFVVHRKNQQIVKSRDPIEELMDSALNSQEKT